MALLEVENLNVAYGDVQVLWDVSLAVEKGEIVALIGSNGAGKSTLLNTISGLLRARSGSVRFEGEEILGLRSEAIVARGLVQVPEGRRLFGALTVRENLLLGAYTRKDAAAVRRTYEVVLDLFPRLRERAHQLASSLSGGEQQMVAIGRGLMSQPKLLMVDELSLGLAPIIVRDLARILAEVNANGTALLIVEQDVQTALELASRGYVLEAGEIRLEGPAAELLVNEEVRKAYLGV